MNVQLLSTVRFDIQGLVKAIASDRATDALRCQFIKPHWDILSSHLQPLSLNSGQVLMEQGEQDRTVYFVESGTLSVHYEDAKGRVRMAMVGAGAVLGEGGFFSYLPRKATVHASAACKLWSLSPVRFSELASQHSPIALELTMAMAAVMAKRLYNRPRRVAVT